MAEPMTVNSAMRFVQRHRGIILPAAVACMIFVILVPLPAVLIDMLLAASIALATVILLTTLHVGTPLEFGVFPSILLVTTLLRLVLNVATTRLILTAGAEGQGVQEAQFAAGRVIWAFSDFVTSGSLAVGVILFAMLVIIQFVVVTKGAARVSEVAARFVLDAMPGKQMAIDADLSAGAIDEVEARERRETIAREADFYGAMDGASRFLRGDAIAAAVITLVNILGGLYVGMVQYNWPWEQTSQLFTRLTIGDGLVTQIPALLISVSAGLIVTRSTARTNLGEEFVSQLTGRPIVLGITGVFLVALTLTSLPSLPLLTMGAGCVGLAFVLTRKRAEVSLPSAERSESAPQPQKMEQLLHVDAVKVELGYGLINLVSEAHGGDLLSRIAALREQIALQLGLVLPQVRICDNLRQGANKYAIFIRGARVAGGTLRPRSLLAVGQWQPNEHTGGEQTVEPAFGTEATWISPDQRAEAEIAGCTVAQPAVVLTTHLSEVVRKHAWELLSRQMVADLLKHAKSRADNLVSEATDRLGVGRIHKVLQNLLRERVSIRDLEAILEALCDVPDEITDGDELTEHARAATWRSLSQQYCGQDGKVWCVCLDEEMEQELGSYVSGGAAVATVPQDLSERLSRAVGAGVQRLKDHGRKGVLLCGPDVRTTVRGLVTPDDVAVLAYNEVDSQIIESLGSVGGEL